ncbi:hypothetical protein [Vibrio parahaemolyticus]|uniref:hypothetical protein n=1 Tax=Vibrio parahaemolyticus TaxID=670 RepID=UPI000471A055|nr:hypothetical protein [Vibrio parahaemolyticus]MDG2841169.1 hypothetical protein [Vibrio parahaemolyticus]MDG2862828.1 hypothetical protein [Vibrio parahaemolyticus]RXQ07737.1 hypothetical protein EGL69_02185 [Vibrio parahaemolyticus]
MTSQEIVHISEVENIVDEEFDGFDLPHPLKDISVWHLLTVGEDRLRMLFSGIVDKDPMDLFVFANDYKYSLRHCMKRVTDLSMNEKISLPKDTIPQAYIKSSNLIEAGCKYEALSRLIMAVYNDSGNFIKDGSGYKLEYSSRLDARYSALEALGHGGESSPDITGLLHYWLRNDDDIEIASILSEMLNSAKVKKRKVTYQYNAKALAKIYKYIPQREEIIPREFVFPWGGGFETQSLVNSLLIRCFYHILTVHKVAEQKKIKGGADSSLLLSMSKDELCNDLEYLADIGRKNVMKFIDFLTYGHNTEAPDPALQPLYRTKTDLLLIPCLHILTSNVQRNILSLSARIMKSDFDRQSQVFEDKMVENLSKEINKWKYVALNKEIKIKKQKEEIDVLIIDERTKTILLLELRWILQPGDAREVYNKIKVVQQKVQQLSRKIQFVDKNRKEVINRLFADYDNESDYSSWNIEGFVVVQGFGGAVSEDDDIPVITLDVLREGFQNFEHLKELVYWVKSLEWLPRENVHFSKTIHTEHVNTIPLSRLAFVPLVTPDQYVKDIL